MASEPSSDDSLWDALNECEFDRALHLLDEGGSFADLGLWRQKATRGNALMGLHRYKEAAAELAIANDLAYRESPDDFLAFGNEEGTALWLMGEREKAKNKWFETVDALLKGTKSYSDFSGGAGSCMLLWYAGTAFKDHAAVSLAHKYLKKISKTRRIENWPGPLSKIALDIRTPKDLFVDYCAREKTSLSPTEKAIKYLHRRELCKLFFYWGIWHRLEGDEVQCRMRMAASCQQLVWLEPEWYLARWEAGLELRSAIP